MGILIRHRVICNIMYSITPLIACFSRYIHYHHYQLYHIPPRICADHSSTSTVYIVYITFHTPPLSPPTFPLRRRQESRRCTSPSTTTPHNSATQSQHTKHYSSSDKQGPERQHACHDTLSKQSRISNVKTPILQATKS